MKQQFGNSFQSIVALMALVLITTACSEDKAQSAKTAGTEPPVVADASQPAPEAAEEPAAAASLSPVFPDALAKGFSGEVSEELPDGGVASVGRICRGSGADVFYVGVKGASSLPDGQHSVRVEPGNTTIRFQTGAPDSGVGAGAAQASFEEPQYTFVFEDMDLQLMLPGC